MSARQELERLRKAHGGILKPEEVVEAAKPRTSPLHRCFTWDDDAAAHQWRLEQARRLLRVFVHIVDDGDKRIESRVFVALSSDRPDGGGYRALADVLEDEDLRQVLLHDAYDDMARFRRKYVDLKELAEVFDAMSTAQRRMLAKA